MNTIVEIGLRVGFIAVALVMWFWTQKLISRKAAAPAGIGDRLHDASTALNAWLHAHPGTANAALIVSSAFIDVFGVYLLGATIFGLTVRPFLALLMVFILRQACQAICTLPMPPSIIWRHPGVPALLVTYGTSNDFFFSGHTAIAVLGAIELSMSNSPWLAGFAALIAVLEAIIVIILRAHYTMDVFAAAFTAWGCEAAAGRLAPHVDNWLRHLT